VLRQCSPMVPVNHGVKGVLAIETFSIIFSFAPYPGDQELGAGIGVGGPVAIP